MAASVSHVGLCLARRGKLSRSLATALAKWVLLVRWGEIGLLLAGPAKCFRALCCHLGQVVMLWLAGLGKCFRVLSFWVGVVYSALAVPLGKVVVPWLAGWGTWCRALSCWQGNGKVLAG